MSFNRTGRWRRFAAAFAALAVGAATTVALAPSAVAAPERSTSVSVKSASTDGLTLTVSGTGYTDLPNPVGGMPGPAAGAYLGVYSDANIDTPSASNAAVAVFLAYSPSKPENPKIVDGQFTQDVFVPADKLDKNSGYTLLVWSAHGNPAPASTISQQELTITPQDWAEIFPDPWSTSVSVKSATTAGLTVTVSGTGYVGLPAPSGGMPGPAVGAYLGIYSDANIGAPSAANAAAAVYVAYSPSTPDKPKIVDGSFTEDVFVPADKLDEAAEYTLLVWSAHGNPAPSSTIFQQKLAITADDWADIFPNTDDDETSTSTTAPTTDPSTPRRTTVTVNKASVADGISVGVSGAGYVNLPPSTASADGVYVALYNAKTTTWADINGSFNGSTGSAEVLDQKWIPSGSIVGGAWSSSLATGIVSVDGDYRVVVWAAHGNLTSGSVIYETTVPLGGSTGDAGNTGSAVAAVAEVDLAKDRNQTVTASGFTPGETVQGTLHSEPVDLGTKVAGADGKVTFTFQIPVGFEVGKHTVVLKGATSGHSVTAAFTVTDSAKAPATTATTGSKPATSGSNASTSVTVLGESAVCTEETVPGTAATPRLNWGVKSSFISYIQSGVANGTIAPAGGAAKAGDSFTWGAGSGSLDANGNGTLTFPGSLHITAHGGVLDLSISNLKVTAKGKTGTLTATIKSQDMQGNPVPVGSVVLADLAFSSLSATGGKATATLTAAGATAFAGFYQAGEQLDPITVSFAGGSSATTKTVCRDADGNIVSGGSEVKSGLASTGVPVGQQLGVALLLLIAGAGAVVLASRRREVRQGSHS